MNPNACRARRWTALVFTAAGLSRWLELASGRRRVLLVIDALNQLDPGHGSHELDWLPLQLPAEVRMVVSTMAGRCLDVLG